MTQFAQVDIALAAPGHPRSDSLIRDAFRTLAENTPFPEFSEMSDIVRRVAASGKTELALALARELDTIAQTGPRVFPAFPHIDAADALYAAGAPMDEVADALDQAEVEFPRDPNTVIGVGVVGGVYSWSGGIGEQARRETATLRAALGDIETALALMDGLSQPNFNWPNVLQPTLPLATVEALFAGMSDDISLDERVYIRVQHAAARLRHAETSENRDWATRQITPVLGSDLQDRRLAHTIYRTVAKVAHDIGAEEIRDPALESLAHHALAARTPGALIGAAHTWHSLLP